MVRRRARGHPDRGASSIELVIYAPILMLSIFLTIQFALIYLGNQAAGSAAREAARIARTTLDSSAAEAAGAGYSAKVGSGILEDVTVTVEPVGTEQVRVVVTGHALKITPFIDPPTVTQVVQGPLEEFRADR
ncbi:TadE/TadG family type IV pilus assembly protein [Kribbella solani]|uniref:TadE/TadG family type IV pilus assembly protein n=1 Tax=Kribbella solani TaxID=236067 RepID=UPI0029A81957|nr:TadE/TadG family type IV pilus assembly protein [Kribbella solani]MDX2973710.1 TadE/TadG family type IV pilus assembly protein [Kribbella solani]MDX3007069.1 TadE/TadG family type IV pilus assembly protein [Kribbella solani]